MTKKHTAYTSGGSSVRRTRGASGHTARRRKKKSYAGPFVALLLLVAVLGGAVWALRGYLTDSPLRPGPTAQPVQPDGETEQPQAGDGSADAMAGVNDDTLLPALPQFTQDGILMTNLENGAKMYERDGVTWLVIGGYEMILCNKEYSLPSDYGDGLTKVCQQAFDDMAAAAAADGITIWVGSGFRSYDTQASIHSNYIAKYGEEYTKSMSAEPGHSEHQTGLAIDVAGEGGHFLEQAFETTDDYAWLAQHAVEYGFILRYQKDKTWATGYIYEPWHFRYVGPELAKILTDSGVTVEEYVGLAKAADASAG